MSPFREITLDGRLSRRGFWLRHALLPGLLFLLVSLSTHASLVEVPGAVLLTLFLLSTWARRLHDRGRSAWWLLAALVPVLGPVALWVECGFRATAEGATRYGAAPGAAPDYLTVGEGAGKN